MRIQPLPISHPFSTLPAQRNIENTTDQTPSHTNPVHLRPSPSKPIPTTSPSQTPMQFRGALGIGGYHNKKTTSSGYSTSPLASTGYYAMAPRGSVDLTSSVGRYESCARSRRRVWMCRARDARRMALLAGQLAMDGLGRPGGEGGNSCEVMDVGWEGTE